MRASLQNKLLVRSSCRTLFASSPPLKQTKSNYQQLHDITLHNLFQIAIRLTHQAIHGSSDAAHSAVLEAKPAGVNRRALGVHMASARRLRLPWTTADGRRCAALRVSGRRRQDRTPTQGFGHPTFGAVWRDPCRLRLTVADRPRGGVMAWAWFLGWIINLRGQHRQRAWAQP